MASIVESLKQEARCSLCSKTPAEPKILKCFHTFCKQCLAEKNEFKDDEKTFSCPSCKTKIDLPQCSDFDSLELSSFHSRILEVLSLTNPDAPDVNCPCKREKPSVSHCFDCARYLCDDCVEAHNTFTDGHHIAVLADLQPDDYRRFLNRETPCDKPRHMKEFIKFYCNTCDLCVCQLCILEDHQGLHDIIDIEARAEIQRSILQSLLQKLKLKETDQLKNLRYLEETACTMKSDAEDTKVKVMKATETLITFIQSNSRGLVDQIDNEVHMLSNKGTEQESMLHQTRSASEYLAKLIEYGSPHLIMTNRESVESRCEVLITSDSGFTQVDHKKKFVPSDLAAVLRDAGLGSLQETKPSDPTKSTVTVQGSLGALSTVMLTVLTRNTAGERNNDPDEDVEINIVPRNDVRTMRISEKIGDKYDVEFTPGVPGIFTAEVKINGRHISNSPVGLTIKAQELKFTHELKMKAVRDPLEKPWGIAVNRSGTKIAITDCHSHCIAVFNMAGKMLNTFGTQGKGEGQLGNPHGIAFLSDDVIVTADEYNHRIQIFDTISGRCVKRFGCHGNGNGEFKNPLGVDVDDEGRIIVSDYLNNRVQVFTGEGEYLFHFDLEVHGETMFPVHAVSHGNVIVVSDFRNHVIHVFDQQESLVTRRSVIGRRGSKAGELCYPRGIAVDNDGNILVCDRNNHRLQKFTMDGRLIAESAGYLGLPIYCALTPCGKILVTDDERKKVLHVQSATHC